MTENVPPRAWVEWARKYMYANAHTYICDIHIFILFKGENIRELQTFSAASPCASLSDWVFMYYPRYEFPENA